MCTRLLYINKFLFLPLNAIWPILIHVLEDITFTDHFWRSAREKKSKNFLARNICVASEDSEGRKQKTSNRPTNRIALYLYYTSKKKSNYILLACNLIHLRMLTKMLTYKTFLISFHCVWLPFFIIIRASAHMISSCCFSLHALRLIFFCHIVFLLGKCERLCICM